MAMASTTTPLPLPSPTSLPSHLHRSAAILPTACQCLHPPPPSTIQSGAPRRSGIMRLGIGLKRREALFSFFLSAAAASSSPLLAAAAPALAQTSAPESKEMFQTYEDEANKFRIMIPQDWLVGAGEASGIKSITAFYPQQVSDSNVSVVITGLGPDFTRLESFGKVDAFAENLVNGLDRSFERPPGIAAKLIDSRAANGLYYVEYTLQNPGERRRHILSAIGMASNGWYNRLYTVTGQYMDDEQDKYRPQIEKSVLSFRLT